MLEIGNESAPAYQFTYIAGAARLADGRVVALDAGSNELRIFDANGQHLKTAAKQGAGPGEIEMVNGMYMLPGDTIVVDDSRVRHLVFAPDGRFVRSVPVQATPEMPRAQTVGFFSDGSFLASHGARTPSRPGEPAIDSAMALHFDRDRALIRTLGKFPVFANRTFGPVGWIAPARDGYYGAWPGEPDIRVHSITGEIRQIIRKPWPTARVTPQDIELFRKRDRETRRFVTGRPFSPEEDRQRDSAVAAMRFADTFALYVMGWPDRMWNLWVRHYEEQQALRDPVDAPRTRRFHYSVFDPSGRWLGDVAVPAGLRLLDVGDLHVVGVAVDDHGVEHVRVHRLIKPGR